MERANEQITVRISVNTIIGNVILSAFKLYAGFAAHSSAMVSDAVESLADVFSTFIVIIGVKLANKESDKEHQYGHERFECVAAVILAVILFATGIGIGWTGVKTILTVNHGELEAPGMLALVAAAVTIAVKEGMFRYEASAAKKTGSSALMADAWHHRSDAFSSIGTFAGILGARLAFPVLDPAACVVICGFIIKAAYGIFMDAIGKMTDKSCGEEFTEKVREVILAQESVLGVDQIKTRMFGDKIYVDVEISADGNSPLNVTHRIAERVHEAIEAEFPAVKHCMVHVNPDERGRALN